ncbi:MAG TPA: hypothetical protein VEA37_07400 [Flavobacterium sp.]|nr:hypothetical protein [Flavobacterium sp.]
MKDFKLDSEVRLKSGFTAPEAYFESFADRLMLQLPVREIKVVPLYKRRPVWVTSAAAALVLSLSLVFTQKESAPDNNSIENYLVYQSGISSYDLIQNLDQEEISELEKSVLNEAISDEDLDRYLIDENISLDE